MRKLVIGILFVSFPVFANTTAAINMRGIPTLADIPILSTISNSDPRYREACYKAQEAFFMHIGATQQINVVTSKIMQAAHQHTKKIIDNYTPLKSDHVFFTATLAYTITIKKRISHRFKNPIFKNVTHIVDISRNSQSVSMEIPF